MRRCQVIGSAEVLPKSLRSCRFAVLSVDDVRWRLLVDGQSVDKLKSGEEISRS
jgi:hypothetical protein